MDKGQLVLFDGFSQYPELTPGDVYTVSDIKGDQIKLQDYVAWYDTLLFSTYRPGISFEHYDSSKGDFTIPGLEETKLRLRRLNWMKDWKQPETIDLSDIHYLNMNDTTLECDCCDGERVKKADILNPGLVLDGTQTTSGRRYRSMDGSHRLQKMLYYGYKTALVYVFHIDEIRNYYTEE